MEDSCKMGKNRKFDHKISPGQTVKNPMKINTMVKIVQADMTNCEKGGQWILSSYAPVIGKSEFPGFEDQSFEEIRFQYYESAKNGTLEIYKEQLQVYLQELMIKIQALQNPSEEIINILKQINNTEVNTCSNFGSEIASNLDSFSNQENIFNKPALDEQSNSIISVPALNSQPQGSLFSNNTTNSGEFGEPLNCQPSKDYNSPLGVFNNQMAQVPSTHLLSTPTSKFDQSGLLFNTQSTSEFNTLAQSRSILKPLLQNSSVLHVQPQSNSVCQNEPQGASIFNSQPQNNSRFSNQEQQNNGCYGETEIICKKFKKLPNKRCYEGNLLSNDNNLKNDSNIIEANIKISLLEDKVSQLMLEVEKLNDIVKRYEEHKHMDITNSEKPASTNEIECVPRNNLFFSFEDYSKKKCVKPDDYFQIVREQFVDLMEMPEEYCLAHCVGEDMNMGYGISVQFRQKFKRVPELLSQSVKQGGLAFIKENDRFVYYLVTKRESNNGTTLDNMFKSLTKMREHMVENNVRKLAIPRIGCDLYRMDWSDVKFMLEYIFTGTDIEIIVCNLKVEEKMSETKERYVSRKCKIVTVDKPITEIESGTLILYIGSEDGGITEEISTLDRKFNILKRYKDEEKTLGKAFCYYRMSYSYALYCLVIKKRSNDPFDFTYFEACLKEVNKENQKLAKEQQNYSYVAMQRIHERADNNLNSKIMTILRNTLYNVEIYICGKYKGLHL